MTLLIERAPAKVNLTLHVARRREDGYHDLESLVAFSAAGDLLTLTSPDNREDQGPSQSVLHVSGASAAQAGALDDNLVLQAACHLASEIDDLRSGAFALTKNLPVAAGLGGGSSDAAAALRLLARANGLASDDARIVSAAARTGSDVPVCLAPRAKMMRGRGEQLGLAIALPPLFAVLVNPRVAVETPKVFARLGLKIGEGTGFRQHPDITDSMVFDELISLLRKCRNDLEDAACVEAPVINDVLAVIAAARGCKLARMSGSGATCFGLFATPAAAMRAARVLRRDHAAWWVKACVLR